MTSKLWYMNADFEMELANPPTYKYLCSPIVEKINKQLAPNLLWLAAKDDSLLLEKPWSKDIVELAKEKKVDLISLDSKDKYPNKVFTPWGWTPSAITLGSKLETIISAPNLELIAKINSKLFSFQLEQEWGIAMSKAAIANNFEELKEIVAKSCPNPEDKWVIKSPMGVAARERVLGRGAELIGASATWSKRKFELGEKLIFQPWLEVIREYGVTFYVLPNGKIEIFGISDLQTNGAGTGTGYLLGRKISKNRLLELEKIAIQVGERLFNEGYCGPVGVDALEHSKGLHPLLEINARYTMGFVAVAVERALKITVPTLWKPKG
ncbi:MAG: hypothetical protein HY819_00910 [Acidobacteria bacterium]|nr:hypothetical protein [Acidobacteriota bacterium]